MMKSALWFPINTTNSKDSLTLPGFPIDGPTVPHQLPWFSYFSGPENFSPNFPRSRRRNDTKPAPREAVKAGRSPPRSGLALTVRAALASGE
jgi:hypothetical protein